MRKRILLIGLIYVLFYALLPAQKTWTVTDPFDQKCFIENNGQFKLAGENANEKILFGNRNNGVYYYFAANGFFISYPQKVERSEDEIKLILKNLHETEEDENEFKYKTIYHTISFSFLNAHQHPLIAPQTQLSEYFNYHHTDESKQIKTISANAFKTIVYENLYPNIDLVFLYKEKEKGLKYYFKINPGGDMNNIQMEITGHSKTLTLQKNGDLEIPTLIGNFVDKAPVAYYSTYNNPVDIRYAVKKNVVSFQCKEYDHSQTLIIDPWVIDPSLPNVNRGYDVDYDNFGNVYVFGGSSSYDLKKYSPTGSLIWTYNVVPPLAYYGDFAVDRNSGSVYITEGFNPGPGASVIKLNQAGSMTANFAGDPNFVEMWRVVFSGCTNQAVIGGGGITSPSDQACYMDTNLTSLSPVNILGTSDCCHDICCIAVDNYGYCYPWFMTPQVDQSYNNEIKKVPATTLLPVSYTLNPSSRMIEIWTVVPIHGGNGMNSMAIFGHNLYTYDTYKLKRWNTNSGALVNTRVIRTSADTTMTDWMGIATDHCGDIYLASGDTIKQYDSTFTFKYNYACPDTIYDIQFSNNLIYASGDGFLTVMNPMPVSCSSTLDITVNVNQSTCDSNASASITINNGGQPPYNILWNTNPPTTGPNIYDLQPDTFIVTVTDNSCITRVFSDTIIITASQVGSGAVLTTIEESNVFTPNADNTNDVFYGFRLTTPTIAQDIQDASQDFRLTIYDRWGVVVSETDDPTIGWNGKIKDAEASEGVYFWIIDLVPTCDPTKTYTYHDNVTLFR